MFWDNVEVHVSTDVAMATVQDKECQNDLFQKKFFVDFDFRSEV